MHARGKLALAVCLSLIAGTLQAAPWERAGSKIQPDNSSSQSRRSTRAYSYSPPAAGAATTVAQPVVPLTAPARPAAQAPAAQRVQIVAPRAQPAPVAGAAPTTVVPRQPATTYAPNQSRGYRSYSYQPSTGNRYNTRLRTRSRVPFYMRADSKIMGREGAF